MRILAFFVFGLGIALAGGGVFFVSEFLKEQRAGNVNIQSQMVRVLVAKGRLRPDTVLGAENLQWAEWPSHAIPPGAFTSIEALFGDKADQKRIVRRTIEPGEPILDGKIWGLGEDGRIHRALEEDMRAVSIQVDAVSSVSGFVSPGDHVDILLTRNVDGQIVSSIPLQDIEILAVDQDQGSEGRSARVGRTVTVKVTPRQAQELAVARQLGKLSLTLRGKGATSAAKSNPPVTQDELDDLEKPETKKKKQIKVNRPDGSEMVPVD
jgi:pilus assembly protein CpaB